MAKKTKPKSKRTQVKDLPITQHELTTDEASKVKGGDAASKDAAKMTLKFEPERAAFNPKEFKIDQSVPWKK